LFFVCKEWTFPPHHSVVEFEVIRGTGLLDHEGSQLVDDRLFLPPLPEASNFLTKGRVLWFVEAGRVSVVKLEWRRFSMTFPGQVENALGKGSLGAPTVLEPLLDLLATRNIR
jgi:hypothetical protein